MPKLRLHLYLTGFMGSGKTTVSRALSKKWKVPCYDIDALIEQESRSTISAIFAQKGESHFRKLETKALKKVAQSPPGVVATGGGLPCRKTNQQIMWASGFIIYLHVSLKTVDKRLKKEAYRRPLYQKSKIEDLFSHRVPAYRRCHLMIDADRAGVNQIIRWIEDYVKTVNL